MFLVNSPYEFGHQTAQGVGLIAACLAAHYIESDSTLEGEKLLSIIDASTRKECLGHALIFSCRRRDQRLVEALLRLGADPHFPSHDDGSMPLECATYDGDIDMICALLASGANPDTKLSSGMSCRTIAHKQGLIEAMELFDQVTARR